MTNQRKNEEFYQIPGSERSRHFNDEVVGPADENKVIQFQIYLKDKFKEEKGRMLEKMANLLPAEREYLSSEEFASSYSADAEDIDKVKAFAQEYGLSQSMYDITYSGDCRTVKSNIGGATYSYGTINLGETKTCTVTGELYLVIPQA